MSISPTSGGRKLQRSVCLKSYNVQKWGIEFTLGFNAAKKHIASKKASNKSCSELNFIQKSPRAHMLISHMSGAAGLQRSVYLKSYNVQKWKSPLAPILGEKDICAH